MLVTVVRARSKAQIDRQAGAYRCQLALWQGPGGLGGPSIRPLAATRDLGIANLAIGACGVLSANLDVGLRRPMVEVVGHL